MPAKLLPMHLNHFYPTALLVASSLTSFAANDQQVGIWQTRHRMVDSVRQRNKTTIASIPAPRSYQRILLPDQSFGNWLRKLPLRDDKTIRLYNGQPRQDQSIQHAVVDIPIGKQDLLQCADAIMYCRARYWYESNSNTSLSFTDNSGVKHSILPGASTKDFQGFLQTVFSYCNSASLAKQMKSIRFAQLQPGDVLLRGGFPGHGAIVADMCENAKGEKLYLLMQGFMPAQDIHVLRNFYEPSISPWFRLDTTYNMIYTPTYWFKNTEAKRF